MSHIHIPDGVLPFWLVAAGWAVTALLLALVTWRLRREGSGRRLPLLGVFAAVMLVGMSTEIVPIGYHANLSVLTGIILGPSLGFLAAFVVNLILAMFGHGGITVVGLNTIVLGAEATLGYLLFRSIWSLLRRRQSSPALAAAVSTGIALVLSSLLMIGLVALSDVGPRTQVATSLPEGLAFQNPLEHGLIGSELGHTDEQVVESAPPVDVETFAKLVFIFGIAGWVGESLLTGVIAAFLHRVRPDLLGGQAAARVTRRGRVA